MTESKDRKPVEELDAVVGLGASAGGLEALQAFFESLPPVPGCCFVVVVHLAPDFKSLMPELLARHTGLRVCPAEDGAPLRDGYVYVIVPGQMLSVQGSRLKLTKQERARGQGPPLPVDYFFQSLAHAVGDRAVGVVFSGSGSDGSRGLRSIKEVGGLVLAEEPRSARFSGMPEAAYATGLCDYWGSPAEVAQHLGRILSARRSPSPGDATEGAAPLDVELVIQELRRSTAGGDFFHCKHSLVRRRILRRMALLELDAAAYVARIRSDAAEARLLRRDLLIGVTSFFRDPEVFEFLEGVVLPELLGRHEGPEVRIWVPACSTGEEAYSIAMLLTEAIEVAGPQKTFKLFATDVNEEALSVAMRGLYTASLTADVPRARLSRFFLPEGDCFRIRPELRERVMFSKHDVVHSPAFSRMDLVSCRNLLIYFNRSHHDQVLAALHFSLKVGGVLLLGRAETVAPFEDAFEPKNEPFRFYCKRGKDPLLPFRSHPTQPASCDIPSHATQLSDMVFRQVLQASAKAEAKTYVLMDAAGQVQDVIGDSAGLLRVPMGAPTADIRRLVVDGLAPGVVAALQKLGAGEGTSVVHPVPLNRGEGEDLGFVKIHVAGLPPRPGQAQRVLLIAQRVDTSPARAAGGGEPFVEAADELRYAQDELRWMSEDLQSKAQEHQAMMEELVASNEELQSTNEELHSVNEELYSVNQEYLKKNAELHTWAADWENLLKGADFAALYLDEELRIRRFTPSLTAIAALKDADVGRRVHEFAGELGGEFMAALRQVSSTGKRVELELRSPDGAWRLLRMSRYEPGESEARGVIAAFTEITSLKDSQAAALVMNDHLQSANRRLEEKQVELEEFFSIVFHDLKRPAAAIDGMLHLALRKLSDDFSGAAVVRDYIEKAGSECWRIQRLLAELRRLSATDQEDLQQEEMDLRPWLDGLVRKYAQEAERRGVKLNYACENARVRAARTVLEQALTNLLENALNYGSGAEGPRVDVSCSFDGETVLLSVSDNGQGIASEHHHKVFQLFRRLSPSAASGTGVGLVAVKRLVDRAGGSVTLRSRPGHGARFAVRVPGEAVDAARVFRVLLVEDNALDAKVAIRTLKKWTTNQRLVPEVVWVKSVQEALRRANKSSFDAAIVGLSLPDGHGLNLCGALRRSDGGPVPLILSGRGQGIPEAVRDSSENAAFLPKAELSEETLDRAFRAACLPGSMKSRERPPRSPAEEAMQ